MPVSGHTGSRSTLGKDKRGLLCKPKQRITQSQCLEACSLSPPHQSSPWTLFSLDNPINPASGLSTPSLSSPKIPTFLSLLLLCFANYLWLKPLSIPGSISSVYSKEYSQFFFPSQKISLSLLCILRHTKGKKDLKSYSCFHNIAFLVRSGSLFKVYVFQHLTT